MAERMTDMLKIDGRPSWGQGVELRQDGIQELSGLPGENALTLAQHDWRLVRFKATVAQPSPRTVPDVLLSLGKPIYGLNHAEWIERLPEGLCGDVAAFGNTAVGPMVHVLRTSYYRGEDLDRGEDAEHETSFGICDAAEIVGNSWFTSSSRNDGEAYDFSEEEIHKILRPEEFVAIDGLGVALAEASQELVGIRQPA